MALQATFDAHDAWAKNLMPKGQAGNKANAAFDEHYGYSNKENIPPGSLDQDTTKSSTAASPIAPSSKESVCASSASSAKIPLGD
ncbi:hypothetical protein BGW39_002691 [Mortierella sp. 14UC]|nr:hypothetical protein BGW39_002691 [Mortierella sp. 14UC]